MTWRTYGKLIVQGLAALFMATIAAFRDASGDGVTASEWVLVVIAGFGVLQVWGAANIPGFGAAKTFMSAVSVVLSLLVSVIVGGITNDEWMFLAIQFLGALGVAGAPSQSHVRLTPTMEGGRTQG